MSNTNNHNQKSNPVNLFDLFDFDSSQTTDNSHQNQKNNEKNTSSQLNLQDDSLDIDIGDFLNSYKTDSTTPGQSTSALTTQIDQPIYNRSDSLDDFSFINYSDFFTETTSPHDISKNKPTNNSNIVISQQQQQQQQQQELQYNQELSINKNYKNHNSNTNDNALSPPESCLFSPQPIIPSSVTHQQSIKSINYPGLSSNIDDSDDNDDINIINNHNNINNNNYQINDSLFTPTLQHQQQQQQQQQQYLDDSFFFVDANPSLSSSSLTPASDTSHLKQSSQLQVQSEQIKNSQSPPASTPVITTTQQQHQHQQQQQPSHSVSQVANTHLKNNTDQLFPLSTQLPSSVQHNYVVHLTSQSIRVDPKESIALNNTQMNSKTDGYFDSNDDNSDANTIHSTLSSLSSTVNTTTPKNIFTTQLLKPHPPKNSICGLQYNDVTQHAFQHHIPTSSSPYRDIDIASKYRVPLLQQLETYRASELISEKPLSLYTITWNVLGNIPNSFTDVLPASQYDIYCIALQECGKLSQSFKGDGRHTNVLSKSILHAINQKYHYNTDDTTTKCNDDSVSDHTVHLNNNNNNNNNKTKFVTTSSQTSSDPYIILTSNNLGTVYTFIAIRSSLLPYIHGITKDNISTGIGDVLANKGASLIRFFLGDMSICVVGAHFNSGQSHIEKRNSDFHKINGRSNLGINDCFYNMQSRNSHFPYLNYKQSRFTLQLNSDGYYIIPRKYKDYYTLNSELTCRSDITIWLGDFNYRLHQKRPFILNALRYQRHLQLLQLDQLYIERCLGNVFRHYFEGIISFPPTYKYNKEVMHKEKNISTNVIEGPTSTLHTVSDEYSKSYESKYSESKPSTSFSTNQSIFDNIKINDESDGDGDGDGDDDDDDDNDNDDGNDTNTTIMNMNTFFDENLNANNSTLLSKNQKLSTHTQLYPTQLTYEERLQEYDTSSKQRIPSWTDRVLYSDLLSYRYGFPMLLPLLYGCVQTSIESDHRPVFATFLLQNALKTFDSPPIVSNRASNSTNTNVNSQFVMKNNDEKADSTSKIQPSTNLQTFSKWSTTKFNTTTPSSSSTTTHHQ